MCRSIKTLYNFDPPATDEELQAAALQFVRKLTGFRKPSRVNEVTFNEAVDDIAKISRSLFENLSTQAQPRKTNKA